MHKHLASYLVWLPLQRSRQEKKEINSNPRNIGWQQGSTFFFLLMLFLSSLFTARTALQFKYNYSRILCWMHVSLPSVSHTPRHALIIIKKQSHQFWLINFSLSNKVLNLQGTHKHIYGYNLILPFVHCFTFPSKHLNGWSKERERDWTR